MAKKDDRDRPNGGSPPGEENDDIKSVIDEAVEAVEAVARRREQDEVDLDPAVATGLAAGNDAPSAEMDRLQEEVGNLRDRLLRTLADFDNFRKRVERERGDERRYATVELLRDLVGVVDNLERALTAEGSLEDLRTGVEMTLRQMQDLLQRSGVEAVEALDRAFDPAVHEAVSRVESTQVDEPTVVDEMQKGYIVHERLLRPSIVRVAVPATSSAAADEDG